MKVRGQKWVFQIGNNEVIVENAFTWLGYSQERVRLNGEVLFERAGWGWFIMSATIFHQFDILDTRYDVMVGFEMTGDAIVPKCRIFDETGQIFRPVDQFEGKWNTNGGRWPDDGDCLPMDAGSPQIR